MTTKRKDKWAARQERIDDTIAFYRLEIHRHQSLQGGLRQLKKKLIGWIATLKAAQERRDWRAVNRVADAIDKQLDDGPPGNGDRPIGRVIK